MKNEFITAINCMDGRVQLCVNNYIQKKYGIKYVDTITMAGPSKILSLGTSKTLVDNIMFRVGISIDIHQSKTIVIAGHFDCVGVPEDDETHKGYIVDACKKVRDTHPNIHVEAIWVDKEFSIIIL